MFEGKVQFRGTLIPVLNVKKIFKLTGALGETLLVIKNVKGMVGLLVDAVTEILNTEQKPIVMPKGVINPRFQYFNGILRHKENLVLCLTQTGLCHDAQLSIFLLSGRLFGARLSGAIEIVPWRRSRPVPQSYFYVEGLIDYRGSRTLSSILHSGSA